MSFSDLDQVVLDTCKGMKIKSLEIVENITREPSEENLRIDLSDGTTLVIRARYDYGSELIVEKEKTPK